MLTSQRRLYSKLRILVDAALFCLAFYVAHYVRATWRTGWFGVLPEIHPFDNYAWLLLVVFPLGPLLLGWQGFYVRTWLSSRRLMMRQVFWASAAASLALMIIMFILKVQIQARAIFVLFGPISFLLVVAKELFLRQWVQSAWGQSKLIKRFLLVGTADDIARFKAEMTSKPSERIDIQGVLDLDQQPIEDLAQMLHEHSANGVILNARHAYFNQIEKAIQICELEGVEAWLVADFFKTQISKTVLDDLMDRPMLVFRSAPSDNWEAMVKQMMDVVIAALLLLLSSWLLALVAILIKATSPGPILFKQQRSGLNGRPFTMLKFRSMDTDADQRKHELAVMNEMSGPVFKVTNDPRITPIGRWLRRYSLDEFPQLWNVLRGDMSLVGPRPLPVDETRRFNDLAHRRRLSVKPGLTCLWQISGRNEVKDFRDWVRLDLEYIDNWSLWLDFKILVRTVPVVLTGTGAR